jgi:hypothetical protein
MAVDIWESGDPSGVLVAPGETPSTLISQLMSHERDLISMAPLQRRDGFDPHSLALMGLSADSRVAPLSCEQPVPAPVMFLAP